MMRRLLWILPLLMLLLGSCREDDGPESASPLMANIVTYGGNNDAGAWFTYNVIDDSPMITLQSSVRLDTEKVAEGTRLYIRYVPLGADAMASGDIALKSVVQIVSDQLRVGSIENHPQWDRDGIFVYAMWRTGNYLNLHGRVTYTEDPRTFMLMVDESTRDSEMPELYVVHELKQEANSHDRQLYASFDMASLWGQSWVKGIKVHVANTNLTDLTTFTFLKP